MRKQYMLVGVYNGKDRNINDTNTRIDRNIIDMIVHRMNLEEAKSSSVCCSFDYDVGCL